MYKIMSILSWLTFFIGCGISFFLNYNHKSPYIGYFYMILGSFMGILSYFIYKRQIIYNEDYSVKELKYNEHVNENNCTNYLKKC